MAIVQKPEKKAIFLRSKLFLLLPLACILIVLSISIQRDEPKKDSAKQRSSQGISIGDDETKERSDCVENPNPSPRTELTEESTQQDFREVALKTGTDKVAGYSGLEECLKDPNKCVANMKDVMREECRPWGHFYDTIYNRWLKPYSALDSERIQFLEIGHFKGNGFTAYSSYLPTAELHSMEISCLPVGPRSEGKWPEEWGNFAKTNPNYEALRAANRLHCGDASQYEFLKETWEKYMKREDAPPLKVVVDDGAHLAEQMAMSLFFWIPRIEPGGILVMEDIQPTGVANPFRTHILPQVVKDLHWCGSEEVQDSLCFPSIQPFIHAVHCEMHICVFVRNSKPSTEPSKENSITPANAFTNAQTCLFGPHEHEPK